MKISVIFADDNAVSSTLGVVLMIAVTVVLSAAVGSFALGLAEDSTKETPSASVETEWGQAAGFDTVDITILGGDKMRTVNLAVQLDGKDIWNASGTPESHTTYANQKWDDDKIESGDTLGLQETSNSGFISGDTIKIVWNNGQKSQVLGSGTLS
jgi:flagellin-like protein